VHGAAREFVVLRCACTASATQPGSDAIALEHGRSNADGPRGADLKGHTTLTLQAAHRERGVGRPKIVRALGWVEETRGQEATAWHAVCCMETRRQHACQPRSTCAAGEVAALHG
jgi:hypothetical protein